MNSILAMGILIVVAAAAPLGPTRRPTRRPTTRGPTRVSPTTPAQSVPISGKDFSVVIRILGQGDFQPEMLREDSQEFQDVREKLTDTILQLYADYDFFYDSILMSLSNNDHGFDAHLFLRFNIEKEGHLNRLSHAIQNGRLGDIEVASKYVSVAKMDD